VDNIFLQSWLEVKSIIFLLLSNLMIRV